VESPSNPGRFTLQDTRTPVWTAAISIGVNIVCGLTLMRFMGHAGLALATTIASGVNVILLFAALQNRLGDLGMATILRSTGKALGCALIMSTGLFFFRPGITGDSAATTLAVGAGLGLSILAGIILYLVTARLARCAEVTALIDGIRSRPQL